MNTAIILAGGRGNRMNSEIPKQYIQIGGRPLLFYTIDIFEKCSLIDDIILVAAEEYIDFCREEIVMRYGFEKIKRIVAGGEERYDSVYNGLKCIEEQTELIFIHDGARACITDDVIQRCAAGAKAYGAGVAAVPVKDTIKAADQNTFAVDTPDRKMLWQIQTPQVFQADLIQRAYTDLILDPERADITDDAMVVEKYTDAQVKLIMGDYRNIKVTTPDDLEIAKLFLHQL